MKKIQSIMITMLLIVVGTMAAQAQIMKAADLEKYAKHRYGDKWQDAAFNIARELTLDKNQNLTYQEVIEAPGKTRQQLYLTLNYWATIIGKTKCFLLAKRNVPNRKTKRMKKCVSYASFF